MSEDAFWRLDLCDSGLASQDAFEMMLFTNWVTEWVMVSWLDWCDLGEWWYRGTWVTHDHLSSVIESELADLTDVTLVSDDT